MTIVSRLQLDHPALGAAGGAGLHSSIEAIYTKIGNNISSRILTAVNLNDTATATVEHDFEANFADLRYDLYLYDETTTELTRITATSSPSLSQFVIAANGTNPKTQIDITNNSGAQRDLALIVQLDPIGLDELTDVDLSTTAPQDGQALVYDAVSGIWKPGASGDASFKLQAVSTPTLTLKGGRTILTDGREIATYDGAGSASTDFGTDLSLNLTTILGSAPANATTYYLYVDLDSLATSPTTLSDSGQQLYPVVQANFALSTTAPTAINRARYFPVGFVKSATTGTAWSGTGSAFGTLATRRHDNGPIAVSPRVFSLAKQAVGAVGSSGQVRAGHGLTSKSFAAAITSTARYWYNLATANDGSGNGNNLTNNGTVPFTGTGILGDSNGAATFNGSTQSLSAAANTAAFAVGTAAYTMAGWFAATDWTPGVQPQALFATEYDGSSNRGPSVTISSNGDIVFQDTSDGTDANSRSFRTNLSTFADNSWHHVALVYDGTTLFGYVDGVMVGSIQMAKTAAPTNSIFRLGARQNTAANFFNGKIDEFAFVKGFGLTAEDIYKLYSYRYDHNTGVATGNQNWEATAYGRATTEGDRFVVDKYDTNSVFWAFPGLADTDQVEVALSDSGLSAVVVPATPPFDQTYTSNPTFPISHGQAEVPVLRAMKEVATGEWVPFDVEGFLRVSATQILGDLATVFSGGATKVRLTATVGTSPTGVAEATGTRSGIASAGTQTFGGDKSFNGAMTLGAVNTVAVHTMNVGASGRAIKVGPGNSNNKPGLAVDNAGSSVAASMFTSTSDINIGFGGGQLNFVNDTYANIASTSNFGATGIAVGVVTAAGAWTLGPASTGMISTPHSIIGTLSSGSSGTSDGNKRLYFNTNGYNTGISTVARTGSGSLGGMTMQILARSNDAVNAFVLSANRVADGNTTDTTDVLSATQAGAVTIGPSSGLTAAPHIIQNQGAAGQECLKVRKLSVAANTNNNFYVQFDATGPTADGYIQTNGSGVLSIVDASDERLKENIRDAEYGLETIASLRPVTYDWKSGEKGVKGFIAQEVERVLPESVSTVDQSMNGGFSDQKYLEIHTMIPVLVKAVQQLKAELDAARAEIAALKGA